MINILAIYYGAFPEIDKLYSRFRSGVSKLKIVVDVEENVDISRSSFLSLYRHLAQHFPTLGRHSCCEEWQAAPLYVTKEEGVPVKRIGELADYPHLLEHLMVDLQCTVGKMSTCSGVTCGWKKPENRFDLFVECDDPRIGIFAACFGAHVLNNEIASVPGEDDFEILLKLARFLEKYPETKDEIAKLASSLNESVANINSAIQQLVQFNFFAVGAKGDDDYQE